MDSVKRWIWSALAVVCGLACLWLLYRAIPKGGEPVQVPVSTPVVPREQEAETQPEVPYVSPIDFAYWQGECGDIYAWLAIPGTDISYPVVQHPTDDEYYLKRDIYGRSSADGALFTQAGYNDDGFGDAVTVIYGHRMNSGAMFGQLQPLYLGDADFSHINEFVVYLPDREEHYRIFAAVPHSNEHILYQYDFSDPERYQAFLDSVYDLTDSAANYDEDAAAQVGDKLVILSTCLKTNRTNRFLVIGKLVETVGKAS